MERSCCFCLSEEIPILSFTYITKRKQIRFFFTKRLFYSCFRRTSGIFGGAVLLLEYNRYPVFKAINNDLISHWQKFFKKQANFLNNYLNFQFIFIKIKQQQKTEIAVFWISVFSMTGFAGGRCMMKGLPPLSPNQF